VKRFDLTASGTYTLAPQTLQMLGKLDKELGIKALLPRWRLPAPERFCSSTTGRHNRG